MCKFALAWVDSASSAHGWLHRKFIPLVPHRQNLIS
jgi:hypothetical protein